MYPGVPTTTPAVQGELFYGVRQIVPAFSFRDRETCQTVWMLDPDEAARVQRRLGSQGHGLLEGGSAYSNIYTGGAKEPHFCASVMGWGDLLRGANPLAVAVFALSNIGSFIRSFSLAFLELFIGLADSIVGIFSGRHAFKELKFIPARIGVCILLRDLITIGACMDAARGLPIVQVNFLGYDEQSHPRGPGSNFAHWTLKGIDRSIRRIWKAAQRSNRRDYQIWIYSDHGQEHTIPYYYETGQNVEDAIAAVLDTHVVNVPAQQRASRGVATQRANWLGGGKVQRLLPKEKSSARIAVGDELAVTALGPLGLVYPTKQYHGQERKTLAQRFV
ncbi:MAG TPA: alkaline phosphatase family protein, partial [Burkholderiaceae bacterium]|nr:alkaline phosphatase family protein [Burkholderiaceae bacterium]